MDVHASGSRSLPYMLLHSLLPTDDACSSSSLSTTVIKFSIFSDPTRTCQRQVFIYFFLRPPYSPALVNGGSLFDCLLTVFDDSYTVPIVKNTQHHFVYQSSQVYQDCTNSVPTVHQSLKTVKNSQKTVKTAKMTIGVPFSFLLF